jgi:hypothetical protein
MQAQADVVAFDIEGAALALGDDFVLLDEPIGRLAEGLFLLDLSPPVLSPAWFLAEQTSLATTPSWRAQCSPSAVRHSRYDRRGRSSG